jgi:hypothetical protein
MYSIFGREPRRYRNNPDHFIWRKFRIWV